jgi:multicomponent Na+:H+ antiporter subunit F
MNMLAFTITGVFLMLAISVLIALIRLVKGPTLPDRVVALDMIAVIAVGVIAVDAVATGQAYFLRAGMILALMAFIGTLAFATYIRVESRRD